MTKRLSEEEFKERVARLGNGDYLSMEPFIHTKQKIKMKHLKCGHTYLVTPNAFFCGNRCPFCSNSRKKKTTAVFKLEMYDLVKDDYLLLSEYTGNLNKVRLRHQTCGHEYEVTPGNFLNGSRCPKCAPHVAAIKRRKTTEQFKADVKWAVNNAYEVLGVYSGSNEKILIKHTTCGHQYLVTPNNFLSGSRCPACSIKNRGRRPRSGH